MIQARVSTDQEHYLVAPTGISYSDVTASGLVKVDAHGSVVDSGPESRLAPNRATFTLISLLHEARPDLKSIIFVASPSIVSVSNITCVNLMKLSLFTL
jgi:adducin